MGAALMKGDIRHARRDCQGTAGQCKIGAAYTTGFQWRRMNTAQPQPNAPQFRLRWYQYSLRTMLVSVAVFCFLLGMNARPHSPRALGHVSMSDGRGGFVFGHDCGWPWSYSLAPR
jgi:hypothetical protein